MGSAQLDLTQLDLGHPQDVTLELKDPARPKQHLGEVSLTVTLWPRNQQEKEQVASRFSPSNVAPIRHLLDRIHTRTYARYVPYVHMLLPSLRGR